MSRARVVATQFVHLANELLTNGKSNRMVAPQKGRLNSIAVAEAADRQKLVPPDHLLVIVCRYIGISFNTA